MNTIYTRALLVLAIGAVIGLLVRNHFRKSQGKELTEQELDYIRADNELTDDAYADVLASKKAEDAKVLSDKKEPQEFADPYTISFKEFSQKDDYIERLTVFYYEKDGILADDYGQVIAHPLPIVGELSTINWGWDLDDPDTIYVRNERLQADFKIIRSNKHFNKTFFDNAMAATPTPVPAKKKRKSKKANPPEKE